MDKSSVMMEIDEILVRYCEDCFLKKQNKIDYGKKAAHRFCIEQCTVGEQLKFLGQELNKVKNERSK